MFDSTINNLFQSVKVKVYCATVRIVVKECELKTISLIKAK